MERIHLKREIIANGLTLINAAVGQEKGKVFPGKSDVTLRRLTIELRYFRDLYNVDRDGDCDHLKMIDDVTRLISWLVPTLMLIERCFGVYHKLLRPSLHEPMTNAEQAFLSQCKDVRLMMKEMTWEMLSPLAELKPSAIGYDAGQIRNIHALRLQLAIRICRLEIRLFEKGGESINFMLEPWRALELQALQECARVGVLLRA